MTQCKWGRVLVRLDAKTRVVVGLLLIVFYGFAATARAHTSSAAHARSCGGMHLGVT